MILTFIHFLHETNEYLAKTRNSNKMAGTILLAF